MRALLLSALSAFIMSALLVPVCRVVGIRLGYVSKPRQDRWHRRETPLFGGVAIGVTVFVLAGILLNLRDVWVIGLGAGAIFVVGLTDDLLNIKPYTKLVAQIALASMFVFFGYRLSWTDSLTIDALLTLVWIVGLTNAFNLLDNMDGLCAGVALIAGTMLLVTIVMRDGATLEAQYLVVLLGATAGFLIYNVHPASIFMGDAGSLFIGLNFAVLTLGRPAGAFGPSSVLSIVAGPLLILLVPIFDTTLVTISRLLSGRSAAQGGRDHSSHRLVAIGLSERAAVSVLWTLAALGGLLAVALRGYNDPSSAIAAAIFILGMVIFAVYLAQVRVYEDVDREKLLSGRVTLFALEFMHKRRVAEVLLDVCLVSIAYYSAYRLRFEGADWSTSFPQFLASLPIVLGVQMVTLFIVGAYRGVWRHFGLMDGVLLARGVAMGAVASVVIILYTYRFASYSRAVFVIYAALLMLMMSGSRASFRLIGEFVHRRRHAGERLVIYGAGDGGTMAFRELLSSGAHDFRMLGFIDDDPMKTRCRIQGYPVLGGYAALESLVKGGAVDRVVISTSVVAPDRVNRLLELCTEHDVVVSQLHVEFRELGAVS
jgi:UDP-GlcNAc:undecaprenyl-phosphate/decaprenyl-phosphate GlcNAc-1-phosphate transferase